MTRKGISPPIDIWSGPWGRRRSARVALEIPVQLAFAGVQHPGQTVLVNRHGALVRSPRVCPLGSLVTLTYTENGRSTFCRVIWSWVEGEAGDKVTRLALERTDGVDDDFWGPAYENRVRGIAPWAEDRRRGPRLSIKATLGTEWEGAAHHVETFDVSDNGLGVFSEVSYVPGTVLRLIQPRTSQGATFRVVWATAARPDAAGSRFRVGMEMIAPQPGFWRSPDEPASV